MEDQLKCFAIRLNGSPDVIAPTKQKIIKINFNKSKNLSIPLAARATTACAVPLKCVGADSVAVTP